MTSKKKREMRWEKRKRFIINILRQIPNIIQILWLKYCLSSDFRNTLKLIYYHHQYSFNNCSSLCIYYYCHSVFITSNFSLRIKQIVMKWNIFMFIIRYIKRIYISFFVLLINARLGSLVIIYFFIFISLLCFNSGMALVHMPNYPCDNSLEQLCY